jgi:hypothetical protein
MRSERKSDIIGCPDLLSTLLRTVEDIESLRPPGIEPRVPGRLACGLVTIRM